MRLFQLILALIIGVHIGACRKKTPENHALKYYNQGNELILIGEEGNALKAFEQALSFAPNWKLAKDNYNYCLKIVDPLAYSLSNPSDMDAWMMAFKQMLDSNEFEQAEEHINRVPSGHDKMIYNDIIQRNKRRKLFSENSNNASMNTNNISIQPHLKNCLPSNN